MIAALFFIALGGCAVVALLSGQVGIAALLGGFAAIIAVIDSTAARSRKRKD